MTEAMEWTRAHFTENDAEEALVYARELIQGKSYNPPGNEKKVAEYACSILEHAGFLVELDEFAENRCNVSAVYGNPDDIALILNGHLDVVPAYGEWKKSPSEGIRENGILYGRGSCDMLGGVASILKAADVIGRNQVKGRRGVRILLVADEEDKNRGIRQVLKREKLKADYAVIAEPTECELQLGNRGFSSFYIRTEGIGCHAGQPWNGENAIYKMGEVIRRIELYADHLKEVKNELLGQATCCIGTIHGGVRLNTVPDHCVIEVERRLLPGETAEQIRKELQTVIGDLAVIEERTFFPASLIPHDSPLVTHCAGSLSRIREKKPIISVFKACTEASMFSVECGIPTLILGPGSLEQAHRTDEFCREQEIRDCAVLFTELLYSGLTKKKLEQEDGIL